MEKTFCNTKKYKVDHSIFGGEIEIEDFNSNMPNKRRVSNQIEAIHLSKVIKDKNKMNNEEERYKSMTLEELKRLRLISNTNGRPASSMTDEKWQKEFHIRKMFITPHPKKVTKLKTQYSNYPGVRNEENQSTYYGCTSWQLYCAYINDVLDNIRSGQKDYCYYIFQILDLVKFHYDSLRTKYCDGYWEVWLDKG